MTGTVDTQISCVFTYNVYENADKSWCVYKYRDCATDREFTAVGSQLPRHRNLPMKLFGTWSVNQKTGRKQFTVAYAENDVPSTKSEIIAYFASLKCGIGKTKAELIYSRFGEKTWEVLEQDPEKLKSVRGITEKTYQKMLKAIVSSNVSRKLFSMLSKANISISGNTVHRIITKLGENAVELLEINPYAAYGVDGFSFDKCDALAFSLHIPSDAPCRLQAMVKKILNEAAVNGHVCLPKDELLATLIKQSGSVKENCTAAVNRLYIEKQLRAQNGFLYLTDKYRCETSICENLIRLMKTGTSMNVELEPILNKYESCHFKLADEQRTAVKWVFNAPVSIITGGPGVGKTTVLKTVLWAHKEVYGDRSRPVLLAPTGKAARRMSEATGYPAMTIHSAVGWRGDDVEAECDSELLQGNLILVDETSMMDQKIASILLEHIDNGTRVVFIGDVDQLPSVGCGHVLYDMIDSGVIPTTRLSVIFRQAETNPIVANSHAINAGRTNLIETRSFRFIETDSDGEAFLEACKLYYRCVKAYGPDNVVLLNPQRNNTELSVDNFNLKLQQLLNPHVEGKPEIKIGKLTFREGDKVMELKNTADAKNGDVGYIKRISKRADPDDPMECQYFGEIEFNSDGKLLEYTPDDLRHVTHAWCSTVHKSQGMEYPTVIQIVSKAHPNMLKKNLIYTGITRARQNVALIGERDAFRIAVEQNGEVDTRCTLLAQRLREAIQ